MADIFKLEVDKTTIEVDKTELKLDKLVTKTDKTQIEVDNQVNAQKVLHRKTAPHYLPPKKTGQELNVSTSHDHTQNPPTFQQGN